MPSINEQDYSKNKVDLQIWRKLLSYAGPYHSNLIKVCVFMAVVSGADVAMPLMMSHFIDNNIMKGTWVGAPPWIAVYIGLVVLEFLCVYMFIKNACMVENGVTCELRRKGFERLQELSFSYYDKTPVGYIMSRLTSDASRVSDTLAWSMVDLFWSLSFVIFSGVTMVVYNWRLGLLVVATTPIIAVVSAVLRKFILKAFREVRRINSRITGAYNEGISGAKTTKTLVLEEFNNRQFFELSGSMREHSIRATMLSSLLMPLVMTIGSCGTAMVLWRGGIMTIGNAITFGQFSFFLWLGNMFFDPINNIARIFAELQSAQAACERVITLMDTKPEITDTPEVIRQYGDNFEGRAENWPAIEGRVTFENVTFKYGEGQAVLKDFDLEVRPGEHIALVGHTGSGKSTIVNLLCRFYEPTGGRILIDGVNYKERSQLWLHSNLGYVLQSPHLFSGSIRENIRYGRLNATDEEVEQVARMINAHDFIMRMPDGYDTDVGEGGGKLSTGEKQLISFARAILADPALFVLDEATSSIDTETEQAIQFAVDRALQGRTSFIIAHRLSTIRNADRILVIDGGVVVEQGTHEQLMRRRGHYYELYTTQFKQEAENRVLGYENEAEPAV